MTRHLDRPYAGQFTITQAFGNVNSLEPACFRFTDGSYGFHFEPGATNDHYHTGVDAALPLGIPLLACAAGTIKEAGWDSTGFGWNVLVDHGGDLLTHVAHMSRIDVHVGQTVTAGQQLGLSGTSGNSTGPHLHWDVRHPDGRGYFYFVDPYPYVSAPVTPPAPPPAPAPQPAAGHPPQSAAEAADVLLRHAQDLHLHPTAAAVNSFLQSIKSWPVFNR